MYTAPMYRIIYPVLFVISYLGNRFGGLDRTIKGFERAGQLWRRLGLGGSLSPETIRARINASYGVLPLAVRCLDQAVVTWHLLNLNGHAAELKIGVTLAPFLSHAWVDLGSERFVDFVHIEDMQIVASYGPWQTLGARAAASQ